uniref:C-type lectin domain family 17, member A-like n=1 Tax=Monopterus albus TaxID=43700 RepID=UPI0009B4A82F|nr:C-type lectin domain family 17, member A-like [Monopterus albus]
MERNSNELNISRAQWSIDAYCPRESNGRVCNACQKGWNLFQSSCYAFNDAESPNQKTWEEARENCTGKISDLAVIDNDTEKDYINKTKWLFDKVGISGYWIGLRAEEGTWKWVDGSNLTQSSWIQQPPTNGLCVTSDKTNVWKAEECVTFVRKAGYPSSPAVTHLITLSPLISKPGKKLEKTAEERFQIWLL